MRNMKKISALLMAMCLICSMTACANTTETKTSRLKVGVTVYSSSDTFLKALTTSMKTWAREQEDSNITVTVMGADNSQKTQTDQVQEMIDNGCNILCVNLVDRNNPSEIIDIARENDVPIIFFNRELVKEDLKQWDQLYYVGAVAEESGTLQGQMIAEYIENHPEVDKNGDGTIQYVVLKGEPSHQDTIIRTETSVNTLLSSGIELDKLSYEVANWSRAQAENRVSQLITTYRGQIELVISNNDDMALGAVDAYQKSNMTETAWPAIFGVDATDDALIALRDGTIQGTIRNDYETQASEMMSLAYALYSGGSLADFDFVDEKYIYVPYTIVTEE